MLHCMQATHAHDEITYASHQKTLWLTVLGVVAGVIFSSGSSAGSGFGLVVVV